MTGRLITLCVLAVGLTFSSAPAGAEPNTLRSLARQRHRALLLILSIHAKARGTSSC